MGLGPPLGAGWVANAFWGRITPCCLAATRSKAHSLIHSDGSVCGIQGRCSTRASLSAGPTCFCTHQVSLYPSATAPGTKGGRYSASSGSLGRSPLRLHPPGGRTPLATERSSRKKISARVESNHQPPGLQPGALPFELLPVPRAAGEAAAVPGWEQLAGGSMSALSSGAFARAV